MVLLRSAFWLGVGYLVVHPGPVDIRQTAGDISATALAMGQRLIVQQIAADECGNAGCTPILAAMLTSKLSTEPPGSGLLQEITLHQPAPVPPPRPDWAG